MNHYVAHATIETHTALARFEGNRVTVWASTQSPFGAREEVARTLGIASQNVRIIPPWRKSGNFRSPGRDSRKWRDPGYDPLK